MTKLIVTLCIFIAISTCLSKPANQEALDKATANDISINSVNPEKSTTSHPESDKASPKDNLNTNSNVYQTSVSFDPPTYPTSNNKPGSAVARIIDDIFQIPISVLQSVARLLRNPFLSHKTPETPGTY